MEISVNSLRIGNYVWDKPSERVVTVDGIEPNWDSIWVNYLNGSGQYVRHIERLEPIPLTEEWLKRFGFTESQFCVHGDFQKDKLLIRKVKYGNKLIWTAEINTKDVWEELIKCEYVHQLQNLYYALTGNELKETKE